VGTYKREGDINCQVANAIDTRMEKKEKEKEKLCS
jgi:hypothetical protein